MDNLTSYFKGDAMTIDTWKSKYQMKDKNGNPLEETPYDMHLRMAIEFARIEDSYRSQEERAINGNLDKLSDFGRNLFLRRLQQSKDDILAEVFSYFDKFKWIIPQGGIMANLGNPHVVGSLSNCFGIAPPQDSYAGIMRADEELAQLMKRRGGVGTHLNNLRPAGAYVSNVSKSSTGVPSFAERYSNTTREVAQEGRRGALMLLLSVMHPDIFRYITMKEDRTKVTGANVTVMFTDDFMLQVQNNADDFVCRFPVNDDIIFKSEYEQLKEFNKLYEVSDKVYLMKIKPVELFDEFVKMAHSNAEPGAAFIDRIVNYSPDGVYEQYKPELCNPCGEQWFHRYDTCRLIAENFFSMVDNPFQEHADVDLTKLYEVSYMQQRYGDDLVDLEIEYIDRILAKLEVDPEEAELKRVEIELWKKIKKIAVEGRRTGNGFTGLGDMIAAMGWKYGDAKVIVEMVMKTKMQAELDATIDMAILRGTFEGWDRWKEFTDENWNMIKHYPSANLKGQNDFFTMINDEFPKQALRMFEFGRRNVSWSTVAPTGTVSLMTQTTSGLEPLFKAFYTRRKKINPNDRDTRVDYTDTMGDKWQEYHVLHPKFKMWLEYINDLLWIETVGESRMDIAKLTTQQLTQLFEKSPWFGSQADDIGYEDRIAIQSIIQKYTSNAISSTINLPRDVSIDTVRGIYMDAWKRGLKGVTIYRDGSRDGVLITETKLTNCDEFGYTDAIPRPETLDADYHFVRIKGSSFAVVVGKLNNLPYELFAFENPFAEYDLKGSVTKITNGIYKFDSANYVIDNLQLSSERTDERLLTRWTSMLLRYGVNPEHIITQVEKSEVTLVNFAKAITRVLKKYVVDKVIEGEACENCGEHSMVYEEGCKKCSSCGHSKC